MPASRPRPVGPVMARAEITMTGTRLHSRTRRVKVDAVAVRQAEVEEHHLGDVRGERGEAPAAVDASASRKSGRRASPEEAPHRGSSSISSTRAASLTARLLRGAKGPGPLGGRVSAKAAPPPDVARRARRRGLGDAARDGRGRAPTPPPPVCFFARSKIAGLGVLRGARAAVHETSTSTPPSGSARAARSSGLVVVCGAWRCRGG